ncbi:hypothetical protein E2C01_087388 [Portunus trituberculatus]|uniref:Uncharacterized protein n=1 Tax=Portunus trituberculatus TaxID=210409 RepID=A0A5B7JH43_PORTR|nr:hypothetical protein [Portunus trituberculatus]
MEFCNTQESNNTEWSGGVTLKSSDGVTIQISGGVTMQSR